MGPFFALVLWIHLFSAVVLVGGSFFIWFVVWPASFQFAPNEAERTKAVGRIAKRFSYFTHGSLIALVPSGLYLAAPYLASPSLLSSTLEGQILLAKVVVVASAIVLIYANNIYHGRKIMRLVAQGKMDDVKRVRRTTHVASYVTLGLLIAITMLGATLASF